MDTEYQKHLNSKFHIDIYEKKRFDIIPKVPKGAGKATLFNRRLESLTFLKNLGVLNSYKCDYRKYEKNDPWPTLAELEINETKFEELKLYLSIIYHDKYAKKHPAKTKFGCFLDDRLEAETPTAPIETSKESIKKSQRKVMYEIKYTENGEIFLNNFLFAKVQFDGENEAVFSYLFKHPNKKITKAEFKEKAGYSVGKPLHKIVDNLGFAGNLRKAFFHVSEKAILFRNPLTRKELEKLNIPQLKLKKKAIT